jgi:hypothetical protein
VLKSKIRSEKTKNLVFIWASLILIVVAIFFFMQN